MADHAATRTHGPHVTVIAGLVSGALAGGCARTSIAPLERVKIIYQTSEMVFSFKGAWKVLKTTFINEGLFSLWRGNGAEMIRIMPYAAIQFNAHEFYKATLMKKGEKHLPPLRRFCAGAGAGATAVACTYPLDLMRARLAIQRQGKEYYTGLRHAFRTIVDHQGPLALFRGLAPTMLGIIPYAGITFFTFETLKKTVMTEFKQDELSLPQRMACGATAGLVGQSAT
mmetsp:Transcript_74981/g.175963  ORF Transcript_74981/g.175963 Transcript_74981/m.175963 type:complete len:227 (+) Transcript_74981:3-683(+)